MPLTFVEEETFTLTFVEGSTGGGSGGSSVAGWIKVADVLPQTVETISAKTWQDSPANTVIQTAAADAGTVRLFIRCSFPLVEVLQGGSVIANGTLAQAADGGHYEGNVDIVAAAGAIVVRAIDTDNADGAEDTITLTLQPAPSLLTLSFTGGYPGAQTELKAGDTFQISGTTDLPADAVEIQDFGASDAVQLLTFPLGTSFAVTMTIGDRGDVAQLLSAQARARDAGGAFGAVRDTNVGGGNVDGTDVVNLNDLRPTVNIGVITYPATQSALKGAETADVANTLADFDSVTYDDPTAGELSIPLPNTSADPKTVTRTGGTFNNSTPNFRITANRVANDAATVASTTVVIANVAPTIDITIPAARLRSGGSNGTAPQDHAVTITSDQPLLSAPTLAADAGGNRGTLQGGGFVGGPSVWTRDLRVDETVPDEKGTFSFASLVATGLAGLVQNVINSGAAYTLGGFVARDLTFAPFATTTSLGVEVADFSNLQANIFTATGQTALKQPIGTPPSVTDGYTIDSVGVNPTSLIWLDTPAASSNSSGTAQITDVEEVV